MRVKEALQPRPWPRRCVPVLLIRVTARLMVLLEEEGRGAGREEEEEGQEEEGPEEARPASAAPTISSPTKLR